MSIVLGIDIGGSGIKGAPVDLATGDFATERLRIDTPSKSTPKNCAKVIKEIVDNFADQLDDGPFGLTVPAPVVHGKIMAMANLHQDWVGLEAEDFFSDYVGRQAVVVNDADAAGLAEVQHGAAKGVPGLVLLTTQGTGIGSALIYNGVLIPNTELGHLELDGHDAESRAASSIKDKEGLSYKQWVTDRLQRYYGHLEFLFSPDLFVVGGGVSKDHEKWMPLLQLRTPMVPATLRNRAGIIGAAAQAHYRASHPDVELEVPGASNTVVE